jgi:hypothetical protein
MVSYVHLLGGRVLDNLFDMLDDNGANIAEAKSASVAGQLQQYGARQYEVVNHAHDGLRGKEVFEGSRIGNCEFVSANRRYPLKDAAYAKLKGMASATCIDIPPPLEELRTRVSNDPDAVHYVVISDITPEGFPVILQAVKSLAGRNVRPIFVVGPHTDMADPASPDYILAKNVVRLINGLFFIAVAVTVTTAAALIAGKINRYVGGVLMGLGLFVLGSCAWRSRMRQHVRDVLRGKDVIPDMAGIVNTEKYKPVLALAQQEKIPVLDLINTFGQNKNFEIHRVPNKEGAVLIARGINEILRDNISGRDQSWIYSRNLQGKIVVSANNGYLCWRTKV